MDFLAAWLLFGCGGTAPTVAGSPAVTMDLHGFKDNGRPLEDLATLRGVQVLGLRPELRRTAVLVILIPDLMMTQQRRLVE